MKRRWHISVAIAAAAVAAAALFGCGRGVDWSPDDDAEGVKIAISGGTGSIFGIASAFKDLSGNSDAMAMTCDVTYSSETDVNAVPIVELTEEGWKASCTAAGKNTNKCIACRTVRDLSGSRCTAYCEGMVPNSPAYELDSVPMQLHFYTEFVTLFVGNPAGSLFRQDGLRANTTGEPWLEADAGIDALFDPGVSSYVMCDGSGGTMSMTAADPLSADPLNMDFAGPVSGLDDRAWRKNFTITGMGNGYCTVDTVIDTAVSLAGVTGGSGGIFKRDPITVGSTWCNDIYSCEAMGSDGTWDSSEMSFRDASWNIFSDGSDGVHIGYVRGEYPHAMKVSQVNEANIRLLALDLHSGQPQPALTELRYAKPPDSFFEFNVNNYHNYQIQDLALIVQNQVTIDNQVQDNPLTLFISPPCAMRDSFYNPFTLEECFDVTEENNVAVALGEGTLALSRAGAGAAGFDMRKPVAISGAFEAEMELRVDDLLLNGDEVALKLVNADGEGTHIVLNSETYALDCNAYVMKLQGEPPVLTPMESYKINCAGGIGEPMTLRIEPNRQLFQAKVKIGSGLFQDIYWGLSNLNISDYYIHAGASFASGSAMSVELDDHRAKDFSGRDDSAGPSGIDSTGYMLDY